MSMRDLLSLELDGLGVVAIDEPGERDWRAFFADRAARDSAASALHALMAQGLRVAPVDVADEDWARKSQAALRAVRVGALVVAPPWDPAARSGGPGATTIIIEPGMGFGSAHHATTRLCLTALQSLVVRGRRVLDIGTGSGVLAIAAARLGASGVLGLEVDPDALDSARTNAGLNGDPPALVFRLGDFRTEAPSAADIVLANLTGAMLTASAPAILRACLPDGHMILSGITAEEGPDVAALYAGCARIEWQSEEDGWIGLMVRR